MASMISPSASRPTEAEPWGPGRHVVHGVLSLDVGGLERLVLDLIKSGVQRGYRVSVVCIERRGQLASQAEALGAQVLSLNKTAGRSSQTVVDAKRLLSQLRPDIV